EPVQQPVVADAAPAAARGAGRPVHDGGVLRLPDTTLSRGPAEGGKLEWVARGLRNPFSLAFSPDALLPRVERPRGLHPRLAAARPALPPRRGELTPIDRKRVRPRGKHLVPRGRSNGWR